MLGLLGTALNITTPAPLTDRRSYEVYLRGPAGAVTDAFGTFDGYRYGLQHLGRMAEIPTPQDASVDERGIQEAGEFSVRIADPAVDEAGYSGFLGLAASWRGVLVDVELVTRIKREDGTDAELVNERRAAVKRASRRDNVLTLDLSEVDRQALEQLVPSRTFTTADWPELYVEHVNRPVPEGVGTVLKVPLTYVVKTGGTYKYAACRVIGGTPVVLTLYRDGLVVPAAEYSTTTQAVGGVTYFLVTFAKEQVDFGGNLHELEADLSCPGSRLPAHEAKRILESVGASADATLFDAAAAYHEVSGIRGDYRYVAQRKASAILEDILALARGQIYRTPGTPYGIFVDRPRDVRLALAEGKGDQLRVDEISWPEVTKTLRLEYRDAGGDPLVKISRTTSSPGTSEEVLVNPYIYEHVVADRHLCYLAKRAEKNVQAKVSVHGVQLDAGDLVAVDAATAWSGTRLLSAPTIQRSADRNELTLREYDESVYVYTPGTLPTDSTNGYSPDYTKTPPAAPTSLAVISQGTSSDNDGKTTAFALIRAVPPAVNWARLMAQVRDTTTDEVRQSQLLLNGGNYEARVAGLRPNRAHQVIAWAVNATDVDGTAAGPVSFTSATDSTVPSAPASLSLSQSQSFEIDYNWTRVADSAGHPHVREYVLEEKIGAGSFAEVYRGASLAFKRTGVGHGTAYQGRVKVVDVAGNESTFATSGSLTPGPMIGDPYIQPSGVSGSSIANSSINRGRGYTGTGSQSGSIAANGSVSFGGDYYMFFPGVGCDRVSYFGPHLDPNPTDQGIFYIHNREASSGSYGAVWRTFLA